MTAHYPEQTITLADIVATMPDVDHSEPVRSLLGWWRVDRHTADAATRALWIRELEFAAESPRVRIDDALRAECQRELSLLHKPLGDN